ncbi:MAG: tyrosine-type recombinase/integrase [Myxococcales bacterium]|nr:tyrosine-type recombinase/integrase [Myxococcales bacterium]
MSLYTKANVAKPPMPWHCLRHSFCTGLADAGVQINIIKELAGHASITTTLRYMHTNSEARCNAIRMAFGRQVGDKPTPKREKLPNQLKLKSNSKRPQRDSKTPHINL